VSRTILDIHVLQTIPPSNVNRDDTGSPKTAIYGGVRRARVSSQAWKRATRKVFADLLDRRDLGVRTKRVVELLSERIVERAPELSDRAVELATAVLTAAGFKLKKRKGAEYDETEFLVFLGNHQLDGLAQLAIEAAAEDKPQVDKKAAKAREKAAKARVDQDHSIEVALFGRMVADVQDLNVEAAAQVAHAISVHAVDNEYDYFTAVDDHKEGDETEDAGAAMIGTVEFNSATYYRYANVDVDRLFGTLGDPEATRRAAEAFVRAFVTSMPTGKQTTFANRTLPDAVLVLARETQPISLVGAYEEAIGAREEGGRVGGAIRRLAEHAAELHASYDQQPLQAWAVVPGSRADLLAELATPVTLGDLVKGVGELVARRLEPVGQGV
jgi:CRISPR system Cascade subunit CasC